MWETTRWQCDFRTKWTHLFRVHSNLQVWEFGTRSKMLFWKVNIYFRGQQKLPLLDLLPDLKKIKKLKYLLLYQKLISNFSFHSMTDFQYEILFIIQQKNLLTSLHCLRWLLLVSRFFFLIRLPSFTLVLHYLNFKEAE